MHRKAKITLLLVGLCWGRQAGAQIFSDQLMFLQSQTQFMTIQSQVYSDMSRQTLERDERNRKEHSGSDAKTPAGTYSNHGSSDFSFTANKGIVQQVEREIVANLKKKDPVSGKNLQEALEKDNPYPNYMALFKKLGLDADRNYADVFTAYLLGMWRIANQKADNPTAAQIRAVRDQVAGSIDVSAWSGRERQEKAAYLVYDLIFANEPYESSRKARDARQMKADSDAVQNRFLRQNNLDLRRMAISENGLTRKK